MTIKVKQGKLLLVHFANTDYEIQTEEVNGTTYWIVPVVMMVEGVHHGSKGPLLYTEEELADSVSAWSGMPITLGHPQDEKGRYVSANIPRSLKGIVGRVYNAKMKGDKLTADAYIDITALQLLSSEAFEYIKEKKALDVSTGVFSREEGDEGEWNGEAYRAAAVHLIPDHLALLPGQDGACSWDDGCGIRNNTKDKMKTNKPSKAIDKAAWLSSFLEKGSGNNLTSNEASFGQIMSAVQDRLNTFDKDSNYHYLEELYDDFFVYCVVNAATRDRTLYKLNYHLMEDGKVEFTGDPVKVRREVSFPVVSKFHRTKFSNKNKEVMNTNKKCKCTVDSLIENKATAFTEDDREYLESLPQERLEKFAPKEEESAPPVANKKATDPAEKAESKEESLVSKDKDGNISINGKSMDQYIKETLAKESDPVKFIDNFMPDGLKEQMKSALTMRDARRTKLIKEIAANSKFKEEQLKAWTDENLETMYSSVKGEDEEQVTGNYAPMGGGDVEDQDEVGEEEIGAMLSFLPQTKKEPAPTEKK